MIKLMKRPGQDNERTDNGKCDKSSNRALLQDFGIRISHYILRKVTETPSTHAHLL